LILFLSCIIDRIIPFVRLDRFQTNYTIIRYKSFEQNIAFRPKRRTNGPRVFITSPRQWHRVQRIFKLAIAKTIHREFSPRLYMYITILTEQRRSTKKWLNKESIRLGGRVQSRLGNFLGDPLDSFDMARDDCLGKTNAVRNAKLFKVRSYELVEKLTFRRTERGPRVCRRYYYY